MIGWCHRGNAPLSSRSMRLNIESRASRELLRRLPSVPDLSKNCDDCSDMEEPCRCGLGMRFLSTASLKQPSISSLTQTRSTFPARPISHLVCLTVKALECDLGRAVRFVEFAADHSAILMGNGITNGAFPTFTALCLIWNSGFNISASQ
jgi:hypothetical protein